jgi:hypothetical protein
MLPIFKSTSTKNISIDLNTEGLAPEKIRLIKTTVAELTKTLTAENEKSFFNHSAEFMRLCACIIQKSQFVQEQEEMSTIPFNEQAIEYSIDVLQEHLEKQKVIHYDN